MQLNSKKHKDCQSPLFVKKMARLPFVARVSIAIAVFFISSCLLWYNFQLSPVSGDNKADPVRVKIEVGASPGEIADNLKSEGVVKSSLAFKIYLRLSGEGNQLKAGTYNISPAKKASLIAKQLISGKAEIFNITFYPGATLSDNTDRPEAKKLDVTTVLRKAGYTDLEIHEALSATYGGPLFASKPANSDLEGYVYGETYQFNKGVSAKEILQRTFEEYYMQIEKNDLIAKFKARGLSLHEGITLASVIEREVKGDTDMKKVAQVFYNRLDLGMNLGSDVTYQYAADKLGVERDTGLDSPYNTRRYGGLPPGPISSPGLSALIAVANPISNDYLFFLSGDDDITYFATNEYGHQVNTANHCIVKCSIP